MPVSKQPLGKIEPTGTPFCDLQIGKNSRNGGRHSHPRIKEITTQVNPSLARLAAFNHGLYLSSLKLRLPRLMLLDLALDFSKLGIPKSKVSKQRCERRQIRKIRRTRQLLDPLAPRFIPRKKVCGVRQRNAKMSEIVTLPRVLLFETHHYPSPFEQGDGL